MKIKDLIAKLGKAFDDLSYEPRRYDPYNYPGYDSENILDNVENLIHKNFWDLFQRIKDINGGISPSIKEMRSTNPEYDEVHDSQHVFNNSKEKMSKIYDKQANLGFGHPITRKRLSKKYDESVNEYVQNGERLNKAVKKFTGKYLELRPHIDNNSYNVGDFFRDAGGHSL